MKIAVCISGHLRTYDEPRVSNQYNGFIEYISSFGEVTVFLSTWNRYTTLNSWSAAHNTSKKNHDKFIDIDSILSHYKIPKENLSVLDYNFYSSDFSPLNHYLFSLNKYNYDSRGIHNQITHSTKILFLIYQLAILKNKFEFYNNKKFDFVFRIRPDWCFNKDINSINLNDLQKDKVYMPQNQDNFAYGYSTPMNHYLHSFLSLSSVFNQNIYGDAEKVLYTALCNTLTKNSIVSDVSLSGYVVRSQ